MPYRRELAGEHVEQMDILVRNAGVPQGRILSLNTALMPGDINGLRYAVVVMHDVTADRRHRDELTYTTGEQVPVFTFEELGSVDGDPSLMFETSSASPSNTPAHSSITEASSFMPSWASCICATGPTRSPTI